MPPRDCAAVHRARLRWGLADFIELLRRNRNYRYTWAGPGGERDGDYFNNIAVFSLVMETTGSGLVVSGVMLARAIPAVLAGPMAGWRWTASTASAS